MHPVQTSAVLFDLDGTLIDTALDMVAVLQQQMLDEGRDAIDFEVARSNVSNGSAGLINLAFPEVSAREHERLRNDYLDRYEAAVCVDSGLFPGLEACLAALEQARIPWGVVTNKPQRMTVPLMRHLGLASRAACMISGDTIPHRKPDPAPMLLACEQIGVAADHTIYAGDALRDIQAGRAAGMRTIAAAYGYIPAEDDPYDWNADLICHTSEELATLLTNGVNLVES